jgi:hypothetical protein
MWKKRRVKADEDGIKPEEHGFAIVRACQCKSHTSLCEHVQGKKHSDFSILKKSYRGKSPTSCSSSPSPARSSSNSWAPNLCFGAPLNMTATPSGARTSLTVLKRTLSGSGLRDVGLDRKYRSLVESRV